MKLGCNVIQRIENERRKFEDERAETEERERENLFQDLDLGGLLVSEREEKVD